MDPKMPIRSIDYTVIFARQMSKMREFYGSTMGFPLHRELSPKWVEYPRLRYRRNSIGHRCRAALACRGGADGIHLSDPAKWFTAYRAAMV